MKCSFHYFTKNGPSDVSDLMPFSLSYQECSFYCFWMKCPISPGMVCFKMKCPFHYLTRNGPPYIPKWNALFIISPGMVLLMFLKALLIWLESVKLQRKKGRSGRLHRGHVETNHGAAWLQWTKTNCISVKGYKQAFQIGQPRCRLIAKDKNCNWKNASN